MISLSTYKSNIKDRPEVFMRIIFFLFFVKFTFLGAVFHLFETKFLGANRKSFLASQDANLQVSNIINFAEINCKDLPLMVWANQYCQHVKIKYLKIMEIAKEKGKISSNLFNALTTSVIRIQMRIEELTGAKV